MKKLLVLIVLIALSSCGASFKLRKAQRLIKEAEAKGASVVHDTIYKDKLVPIKGASTVVSMPIHHYHDTTFYKDKILIKNMYHDDTLVQYIKCPDSTAHVKEAIGVTNIINCPPPNHFWKDATILLGLIVAFIIFLLVKKK